MEYDKTKPVVIVVNTFGRGGAEMSLALLAHELAKSGQRVYYVALWRGTDCYNFCWLEDSDVCLYVLCEAKNLFGSLFRLVRWLRANRPKLIYSAMLDANLVSQISAHLLRVPHIASVRSNPAQYYKDSLFMSFIFVFVMWLQNNIVFISRRAMDEYLKTCYGRLLNYKRLFVLHNPIAVERLDDHYLLNKFSKVIDKISRCNFTASLKDCSGLTLNFVIVSRLVDGKGIIETLEQIKQPFRNQGMHLSIYGAGPLEKQIRDCINNDFPNKNVTLKGFCSDVDLIFAESDILIFPSRNEGFGRVPFEGIMRGNLVLCNQDASIISEFLTKQTSWINYKGPLDLLHCIEMFKNIDPSVCVEEVKNIADALKPSAHAVEFEKIVSTLTG